MFFGNYPEKQRDNVFALNALRVYRTFFIEKFFVDKIFHATLKVGISFFFFKNMEIFDVPGLTLRHELKAGDLGRLIEYSGIYGHSDFDYPIAFKGYVATTFAEYVIDPKPRNRLWMVEDEQGLVGTIRVMDRGDSAQLRWFSVRPDWRENNLVVQSINTLSIK